MILHFGVHKTGSTSIQRSLFRGLKDPRFHYVRGLGENASFQLITAFEHGPRLRSWQKAKGYTAENIQASRADIRARLEAELRETCSRGLVPILSGEGVLDLHAEELRGFCAFLRQAAGSVRAVGYMRTPHRMFESKFQQRVKQQLDLPALERDMFHFRPFFEVLLEELGRDQVELRVFDRRVLHQGCVVRDFCRRVGIDFDPADVIPANESLSRDAVSLLYLHYLYGAPPHPTPEWELQVLLLVSKLKTLSGPRLHFHPRMMARLIAEVRPEKEWLERTFGIDLSEDPARHDAEAVRSLDELRSVSPSAAVWLDARTGTADRVGGRPTYTPEAAAQAMARLRVRMADRHRLKRDLTQARGWRKLWIRLQLAGRRSS